MRLTSMFERLVVELARSMAPTAVYGRKRVLSDKDALAHIFTILRTGMQWREINSTVHCTTVLRRFHTWVRLGEFKDAYTKALCTYNKLNPIRHYGVDSSYVFVETVTRTTHASGAVWHVVRVRKSGRARLPSRAVQVGGA